VSRSARGHDVLKHWHSRGVISDEHLQAGRRIQRLYELACGGGGGRSTLEHHAKAASGPGAAPVAVAARSELAAIRPVLGETDFGLICRVLGQGAEIGREAAMLGDAGRGYVARRIRDALNVVAMRDRR
jgi:hypothetical protein